MKIRAVVEVMAETYEEQQMIISRFPDSVWISLKENKCLFYIDYSKYSDIIEIMDKINLKKIEEKKKGV